MTEPHRFGPGAFVLHKGRVGLVVAKQGHICPWYWVEFHQPMPTLIGEITPAWLDRGGHRRYPEWHYDVSLEPVPRDWAGVVPASLLRRIRGFGVLDMWFQGFCFGRSKGWEDKRRKVPPTMT